MNKNMILESDENAKVGYVQFPLTQKGFSEFVNKLLGEPQQVQGVLEGSFIVDIRGIEKLYATIMQRVNQQNKANLIDFISKIYFGNETNITLKSLEGLTTYRNLEDLKVVKLELTWIFLIKFEDKEAPEKQVIRIRFDTKHMIRSYRTKYLLGDGGVQYDICYTARTWGIDIENLIRNAINSTFIQKNKWKEIVKKIKEPLSLLIPTIIYVIVFCINGISVNSYLDSSVQNIVEQISKIQVEEQFSFVAKYVASTPWYQFTIYNNLFLIIMLIVCIVFGFWLDDILDDILEEKSFIFLLDSDERLITQQVSRELGKQTTKYVLALMFNIVCGVLSNFIFQLILKVLGVD